MSDTCEVIIHPHAAQAQFATTAYVALDSFWRQAKTGSASYDLLEKIGEARAAAAVDLRRLGLTPPDREALFERAGEATAALRKGA